MKSILRPFLVWYRRSASVFWWWVGYLAGCVSPGTPVVTQTAAGPVTNIPAIVNPNVNSASNTAAGIAGAVGLVPAAQPYSAAAQGLIALVFGAIGSVSTYLVQKKNSATASTLLATVIQGVEDGTSAATVTAAGVKAAIQARATAAGVQPALDAKVQSLT